MLTLSHLLEQVATLRTILAQNKENLIRAALLDCAFTYRESALEVETVQDRLAGFPDMAAAFAPRSQSWVGAFVSKPVGGYGYSGWIWEPQGDTLILKQGPKLLSLETSREPD